MLYDIGTKVKVSNPHAAIQYERKGVVAGHAHLHETNVKGASPVYLIRLDEGFASPAGDTYISVVVMQPDCVSPDSDTQFQWGPNVDEAYKST